MKMIRPIHVFPLFLSGYFVLRFDLDVTSAWSSTIGGGIVQDKKPASRHDFMPQQLLDIDPTATLASDIEWIGHDPVQSRIVVQLSPKRKCQRPVLIGRLSGPLLAVVQWQRFDDDDNRNNDQVFGFYSVPPVDLQYNLEIIAERCEQITWHENFTNNCLEDVHYHRITLPNATISHTIDQTYNADQQPLVPGMWRRKPSNPEQAPIGSQWARKENFQLPDTALMTRVQPPDCVRLNPRTGWRQPFPGNATCDRLQAQAKYSVYDFYWNDATQQALKEMPATLAQRQIPQTRVCFYGASHARYLTLFTKSFVQRFGIQNVSISHADYQTADGLLQMKNLGAVCNIMIVGVGQWDAGYPWYLPTLSETYHSKMRRMAQFIQQNASKVQFYFRSMHLMPMGYKVSECPPTDWRSPSVVALYNNITRQLSREYHIPYLDTDFIIQPVWDSSADWCHYGKGFSAIAGIREAEYILAKVLDVI